MVNLIHNIFNRHDTEGVMCIKESRWAEPSFRSCDLSVHVPCFNHKTCINWVLLKINIYKPFGYLRIDHKTHHTINSLFLIGNSAKIKLLFALCLTGNGDVNVNKTKAVECEGSDCSFATLQEDYFLQQWEHFELDNTTRVNNSTQMV